MKVTSKILSALLTIALLVPVIPNTANASFETQAMDLTPEMAGFIVDDYEAKPVNYYPNEIDDVLVNPYMGLVPWARSKNYTQPHSMVYMPILWKDLEPERGEFNWEGIESANNISYWKSKGVKINIRFYMDDPDGKKHMDIPQWLYDGMGENKGTEYAMPDGNKGFSPNYSDPYLIQEHERVIKALAQRYNDDPSIAFIQIGSIGHWGEYHCWPYLENDGGPSGDFPPEEIADQYLIHYVNNFDNDKLCMRRNTSQSKKYGMGLFNDMIGDTPSLDDDWGWLSHIKYGYDDEVGTFQPADPDFWKYGPAGGEFANGSADWYVVSDTIDETIRQVVTSHTSWIGPCCPSDLSGKKYQSGIDRLLKTIGYRYVIKETTHPDCASADTVITVDMDWENKGIAPFYFDWKVKVGLANDNGVVTSSVVNDDIREWLPGDIDVKANLEIPADLPNGDYKVVVGIIDPATDKPGVNLAIDGKRADGWYELDTLTIMDGVSSSENPTFGPTATPTLNPTAEPTQVPTQAPTQNPTLEPTSVPTWNPTDRPTEAPTWAPTQAPTAYPTNEPTSAPTDEPSQAPTAEPTMAPTAAPTTVPTSSPNDDPISQFVKRLYLLCMGREADASGLNFWREKLINKEFTGAQAGAHFFLSSEFTAKEYSDEEYLEHLYQVMMGRKSDSGGMKYWGDLLKSGVGRQYVLNGFITSKEFGKICKSYGIELGVYTPTEGSSRSLKLSQFVGRLYNCTMKRSFDSEGINFWCDGLYKKTQSVTSMCRYFYLSDEFKSFNTSDLEYLNRLYATFFGRTQEDDPSGFYFWLNALKNDPNWTRERVLYFFIDSPEFSRIKAQFGL
ncbi:MAG: DUF4214 domain-containing protein [Lachnospiraceae bacterium]|nr:DUF4214 domain-containing protein [Lachnospiraceae bacterium]